MGEWRVADQTLSFYVKPACRLQACANATRENVERRLEQRICGFDTTLVIFSRFREAGHSPAGRARGACDRSAQPSDGQRRRVLDSSQDERRTRRTHSRVLEYFAVEEIVVAIHVPDHDVQYVVAIPRDREALGHLGQG